MDKIMLRECDAETLPYYGNDSSSEDIDLDSLAEEEVLDD